jgi:hypothetical protein
MPVIGAIQSPERFSLLIAHGEESVRPSAWSIYVLSGLSQRFQRRINCLPS